MKKGKRRFDISSSDFWDELGGGGYIDWANLPPLDGEEGELIDDEACVIDVRAVTGLGEYLILSNLLHFWVVVLRWATNSRDLGASHMLAVVSIEPP